jgi:hypothetical protein
MYKLIDITRGSLVCIISAPSLRSAQLWASKHRYDRWNHVYPA